MTEHTSGPWIEQGGTVWSMSTHAGEPRRWIGTTRPPNIASSKRAIQTHAERRDEDIANARLIAAAPDLLAALEAVLSECVLVHRYGGAADNTHAADVARGAALTAIAKARGE